MKLEKISEYIGSTESIYILLVILATVVNIIVFNKKPHFLLLINIAILILYFLVSKRKDKKIIIFASLNFAFWGILIESFIIKNSNFALNYRLGTNISGLYVPAWLFTIYIVFVLASVYTYNFYKTIF